MLNAFIGPSSLANYMVELTYLAEINFGEFSQLGNFFVYLAEIYMIIDSRLRP
jgi:hypothetical protein